LIAKFASGGFAGELPVDFDPVWIHPAIPGVSFLPQHLEGTHLAVCGESEASASAAMRRVQSLAGFTFEIPG